MRVEPPVPGRVATSSTRPLQFAIAGLYALTGVYTVAIALWKPTWLPVTYSGAFEVGSFIAAAASVVAVIGATRRWRWLYNAVFVIYGLGTLALVVNLIRLATGGASSAPYAEAVAFEVPGAILFAWMVLLARRGLGPWGMTKPAG